jgi:uncharacterized protein YbaP (TraB family)
MRMALFLLALLSSNFGLTQLVALDKELLWEVSNPKSGVKSYLFGTLHANNRELFELSDSVYFAFDQAQKIVLETDIYSLFSQWTPVKTCPKHALMTKASLTQVSS